ncbi:prepilin-type N-terminal cleavage/methylation domain-containing protein [Peptoniphilus asaccharolyticus DSM 20463]|uniref:Prepilin-type N-terminal cleavage/methylation domain-containing protein n=1 Tax=Peptoniphilus asaccharolyticus DSM 20463 TaxID=573058 RepID=A0A1W1UMK9_PEPAS|nr:type II secretion system protein [Peptoniphilus asaccharolyticus]MBL7574932.1 type II secretion system protein [Peptoniphilus asaccharolyticus]SMB82375.1 prepilin-type N-terminal cleavage/methylation domain-containing protein [Peptoniphilus asaccharolyticus DSM 20463]
MKTKRGYTLIELVIAIGVIVILGSSIVSAYINLNNSRSKIYEVQNINNKLQNAMEETVVKINGGEVMGFQNHDVNVKTKQISEDLFEVSVSFGEKYELKKLVKKGIHTD